MDIQNIGEKIRKYRKIRGFTQEELAERSGLSVMSIRRYENGSRIAPQDKLLKIAKALDIHLRDLSDSFIWDEFDKQYPNIGKEYADLEDFLTFLETAGYHVKLSAGEVDLSKEGYKATFTESEFEDLQSRSREAARESIDTAFYKMALEQQQRK